MDGWVAGWMDGWMEAKAGLRIAYSNKKIYRKIKNKAFKLERHIQSEQSEQQGKRYSYPVLGKLMRFVVLNRIIDDSDSINDFELMVVISI